MCLKSLLRSFFFSKSIFIGRVGNLDTFFGTAAYPAGEFEKRDSERHDFYDHCKLALGLARGLIVDQHPVKLVHNSDQYIEDN
jgi:hypothetical protein